MRIAAEKDFNGFASEEITRIGLEIGATFDKVAQPFKNNVSPLRAKIFIEVEEA